MGRVAYQAAAAGSHSPRDYSVSFALAGFSYDRIGLTAETDGYFVFVFSQSHAQIYDKNNLSGGTADELRKFISEVTNKEIITVK